jgi:hypothetical protein
MNESVATPTIEFKDRRTGLIVFGILLIIGGSVLLLMVPMTLLAVMVSGHLPHTEPLSLRAVLPGLLVILGESTALIWLGVGSILCRRWARALILIVAWLWLWIRITSLVSNAVMLPRILAHPGPGMPATSPALAEFTMIFALGFGTLINILFPGALILFFRSANVKATCEARDQKSRWTEKRPLPVLGLVLLLAAGAAMMPTLVLLGHRIVPFFGYYITGTAATATLLLASAIYAFAAYSAYKLKPFAWWLVVGFYAIITVSFAITFARSGLLPMYEGIGLPPGQILQLKQAGLLEGPWILTLTAFNMLGFVGLLAYVKRFFSA